MRRLRKLELILENFNQKLRKDTISTKIWDENQFRKIRPAYRRIEATIFIYKNGVEGSTSIFFEYTSVYIYCQVSAIYIIL